MSAARFHRFLLFVRADPSWTGADWRASLLDSLRERGLGTELGDDGQLHDRGPSGLFEWATVDEGTAAFPGRPWLELEHACPFVGPVVGFLTWEWWEGHRSFADRSYFVEVALGAARGRVVRTDTDEWLEGVVTRDFRLANVAEKSGFCDGDFFLPDEVADAHARRTLTEALAARGLHAELSRFGTSHNPYRIERLIPRPGETLASCWDRFRAIQDETVTLWGWNLEGLASERCRRLLGDP